MSGKHKLLFFLLTFIGVGYVLNSRSMEKWGAEAVYPVVGKKTGDPTQIGNIHKFYLVLNVPPEGKLPKELPVPDYVYDVAGGESDQVNYSMRGLPFLKLEGKSYELMRSNGTIAKEWGDGVVPFWFGFIGTAIAAGIGVVILLTLLAKLFGYGGNTRD